MHLVVTHAELVAPEIRTVTLADPGGATLPSYTPGSHLVVHAGGVRNAYSLTGDGTASRAYPISVLRRAEGAGGSAWLHGLEVGQSVQADPPRSLFAPVATARRHLLVAGGIGITPMVSHVRAARRWDRPFRLLYGYRAGHGAHLADLRQLAGSALSEHTTRSTLLQAVRDELWDSPLGTHAYVCGPAGLLAEVRTEALAAGWPDERLHEERFAADPAEVGRPFRVRLHRSGRTLQVAAGQSLLDRLIAEGVPVPFQCRRGVCGECRVPVLTGRAEHRDHYLSAPERSAGTHLMTCVSRAAEEELELEL